MAINKPTKQKRLIVTGSSGLIGSAIVEHFASLGHTVIGFDNNGREEFFGREGSTIQQRIRLEEKYSKNFTSHKVDITDRFHVTMKVKQYKPDVVVHCAAQPSHDLAAKIPFRDWDVNANGTFNMLEATRLANPEAVFVQMSTNKVYGDNPNKMDIVEEETRYEYAGKGYIEEADTYYKRGVHEGMSIDHTTHSLFGASKVAGDVVAQEYGRYFGMPVAVLRCGCLTGAAHAGVELHGFLSYLIKCAVYDKPYTVFGYKGKQVRDNIDATDVASFIAHFADTPKPGAHVYNLGGGYANSISVNEAINLVEQLNERSMNVTYSDEARRGDHICYYSDLSKCRTDFPTWKIEKPLNDTFAEIFVAWQKRKLEESS